MHHDYSDDIHCAELLEIPTTHGKYAVMVFDRNLSRVD
jgi:hypothetical protein